MINRRRFILAPAGMSWNESVFQADAIKSNSNKPAAYPNLADLGNGKYWTRVADEKLIPFVKFTTTDGAIKPATGTPTLGK